MELSCQFVRSEKCNIGKIRQNAVALRTVDRTNETYLNLVDSIRSMGILNPISVTEKTDEIGEKYFEIVDGLHRYSAAKDAGMTEMIVSVMEFKTNSDLLCAQIIANVQKVETKPSQYSEGLKRLLNLNPMWTMKDLADKLGRSPQWIEQRLQLLGIRADAIKEAIDKGTIPLTSAYALAKLPETEQENFFSDAMVMEPSQFIPLVTNRVKEINTEKRKGRVATSTKEFVPVPHLRKVADLVSEKDNPVNLLAIVDAKKLKKPADIIIETLKYVLSLDDDSVEEQKSRFEARKKAEEEAREKKKADAQAAKDLQAKNALANL